MFLESEKNKMGEMINSFDDIAKIYGFENAQEFIKDGYNDVEYINGMYHVVWDSGMITVWDSEKIINIGNIKFCDGEAPPVRYLYFPFSVRELDESYTEIDDIVYQ